MGNIHETLYKVALYNDADIKEASVCPPPKLSNYVQGVNI